MADETGIVELTDDELAAAMANTRNRGEYQARVKRFIDSAARSDKVLLNGRKPASVQISLKNAVKGIEGASDQVRVVSGPADADEPWVALVRTA